MSPSPLLLKKSALNPAGDHLVLRAGIGWHEGLVGHAMVNAGVESQAGYTLSRGEPVTTHNLAEERRFSPRGPPDLRESAVCPPG